MAKKRKKIILLLGNGYNSHFKLKMDYSDFFKQRYQLYAALYNAIELATKGDTKMFQCLETCWKQNKNSQISVWEIYFASYLKPTLDFKMQETNIESFHFDSFDIGFWNDVVQYIFSGSPNDPQHVLEIVKNNPNMINFDKCFAHEWHKLKLVIFIANILNERYGLNDKKKEYSKNYMDFLPYLYDVIYKELELFERCFGMFLEDVEKKSDKKISHKAFFNNIKNTIDPDRKCKMQILTYNYNSIGNDIKFPCEYLHGRTNKPIFGGIVFDDKTVDRDYEKYAYTYMFSKLYRRRKNGLKKIGDILNKDEEHILAIYGIGFAPFDIEELSIIHNYKSDNEPLYFLFSQYNDDPHLLGKCIFNSYYSFYRGYWNNKSPKDKTISVDQFYEKVERKEIIIGRVEDDDTVTII